MLKFFIYIYPNTTRPIYQASPSPDPCRVLGVTAAA